MKLIIANIINLVFATTVTTTNAWREDQVVMLTSWADPNECTFDNHHNMVDNCNKKQGPYEPDVCNAGNTIPVNIILNNNGTECYVHPNNRNLVFWISRPPTGVDRLFTPSDDLRVRYLKEAPFIPRSDCNEQGVCVCDAINSFRDSIVDNGFLGGFSTTPAIRPDSDPTCGIDQITGIIVDNDRSSQGFCTPIQGTLELYLPKLTPTPNPDPKIISGGILSNQGWASAITAGLTPTPNPDPKIISGGIISNQGWASAITAGCITTMIILSMMS